MKIREKNILKGFTLTELLVVIVILGIIVALSIPLIRNIKSNNKNRKFDTYEKSLVDSAKLYTDSYGVDMFGNSNYGCVEIPYSDLKKKSLIKDIQVSDATCEDAKTYVRVIKLNDKYTYETHLSCTNKKNNKIIFKADKISNKDMECNGGAVTTGPTIVFKPTLDPEVRANNSTKNKTVKVEVKSDYGMAEGSAFYYAWSNSATGSDINTSSWKRQNLGNDDLDKIGYSKTFTFNTNNLATGDYYLFVRTTDNNGEYTLKDGAGNANEQTMFHAGAYVVDKTKPNISTVSVSSSDSWNSMNIKVNMNSAKDDVNLTNLKVCLTQGSATCLDKDFVEPSKAKLTLTGLSYNGASTSVNVFVRDLAGNEAKQVVNYTLYKECETANLVKTTLKSNGTCSKQCGGGTRTDVYNTKDKNSNNACAGKTINVPNVACNTMSCCSKTTVSCGSWGAYSSCTKKCGTGTQTRTRTCSNVSAYDGSYCSANTVASNTTQTQNCNTMTCCSSTTTTYGAWSGWGSCNKSCGGGTQTRTRTVTKKSAYDGSTCSESKETGTQNCNTMTCCSKTTTTYGSWSGWSGCSASCGGGNRSRTRTVTTKSAYDGSACGATTETELQACNTQSCAATITCCRKGSYSGTFKVSNDVPSYAYKWVLGANEYSGTCSKKSTCATGYGEIDNASSWKSWTWTRGYFVQMKTSGKANSGGAVSNTCTVKSSTSKC